MKAASSIGRGRLFNANANVISCVSADQRIHACCSQRGYAGIALWMYSGREEGISQRIAPGAICLLHCTDDDLSLLREFIPEVARGAIGWRT